MRLPFNSISFLTIKFLLANEVHCPFKEIIAHYVAPLSASMLVEITLAVTLI
jgi:hypothetical protein